MMRILVALLFFAMLITACKKPDPVSDCIQSKADSFKTSNAVCDHGASIKEYRFQGKLVYVFDAGNCIADGAAEVDDADCHYLGFLGGFVGNTKINGLDFSANAFYLKTIWQN